MGAGWIQDYDHETHDHDQHTAGTQDTSGKGRNTGKAYKQNLAIIERSTRKKQKKLKKICNYEKTL